MMEPRNFTADPAWIVRAQGYLAEGERLVAVLDEEHRTICLTSERMILLERRGGWSAIRNSQIAAVEVSPGLNGDLFVKVLFGGGLSRTLGARDEEQARVLASALAFG